MTIYIDTLFLVNFFMDTVIFFITSRIALINFKIIRIFISAALSALYGCFIFLPEISIIYCAAFKLLISLILVLTAFGFKNIKIFLKVYLLFWLVTVALGGVIFAILVCSDFAGVLQTVISNGVIYMNINPFLLLIGSVVLYMIMEMHKRIIVKGFFKNGGYVDFSFTYMEKEYCLKGFIDTGCSLFEPITDAPVIVVKKDKIEENLSLNNKLFAKTAAGLAELDMLVPQKIISLSSEYEILENTVVAISENLNHQDEYDALINPMALNEMNNKRGKRKNVIRMYS